MLVGEAPSVVGAPTRGLPGLLLALTALSFSGADGTTTANPRQASAESPARQAALASYGALPLAFVRNAGQLDRRVRYSAQAGGARIHLTPGAVTLALAKGRRGLALRLAFLGASSSAPITGAGRGPGRLSYLIGNDPARWQRNLPTYREVVYRGLWPGVDLAVRGRGGQLKYEFRLAPGADPARIRPAYHGQERLSLDRNGALRVETALGLLRDSRPVSYQPIAGRRVAVRSRFALGEDGAYRFVLGSYDPRYPLIIDPGLVYSTYIGGVGYDAGSGIAVNAAGSAYVAGTTSSRNLPTTAGAFDRSYNGASTTVGGDVFVMKLNPAGTALAYLTYLGGRGSESAGKIAVNGAGNAYLTGVSSSTNFPTTAGAFDRSYNGGGGDAFVAKLNAAGTALAYSTYLGGSRSDSGGAVAVGKSGSAYVMGSTNSTDFPTTARAFDRSYNGGGRDGGKGDVFVLRLNAAGNALSYATYVGGRGSESGSGIAVDGTGRAYVAGSTYSRSFPTTPGAFDTSFFRGDLDAFVTKLNAAGSALVYSTYLGGKNGEYGEGIAVDRAGCAYVIGATGSRDFPTTAGALDRSYNGNLDAFVSKINAVGSALVYSTYLGGGELEEGEDIAVDRDGSAYLAGYTTSRGFPTTPRAFDRRYNGNNSGGVPGSDVFVTKLRPTGTAIEYSTYFGGGAVPDIYDESAGNDDVSGIAVDGTGRFYVTGSTHSRSFPTTVGAIDTRLGGDYGDEDGFVARLDLLAGLPNCIVPTVVGRRVAEGKRTIRAEHCSVGRVRRVRSKRVRRVVAQRPRAGSVRRRGFKVNLVVGRR